MRARLNWLLLPTGLALGIAIGAIGGGDATELTCLSVGQGDCSVFRSEGHTILIDAGPMTRGVDGGERFVVPALKRMGVVAIDLVMLSHPDADHIGGLPALSRHFKIGKIVIPASFRAHPDMVACLAASDVRVDDVAWVDQPVSASIGGFSLYADALPWRPGEHDNDGSMFVKLSRGPASAVFTGDASEGAELQILHHGDWGAQLLHVGHHGSRTSTCDAWLDAVHPKVGVISCGRNNPYGHPSPFALARLIAHGVKIFRTDRDGDLSFGVGETGFERK